MFASYNNHSKCIQHLLEFGADITVENEDELCAVDFAVRMGSKPGKYDAIFTCLNVYPKPFRILTPFFDGAGL